MSGLGWSRDNDNIYQSSNPWVRRAAGANGREDDDTDKLLPDQSDQVSPTAWGWIFWGTLLFQSMFFILAALLLGFSIAGYSRGKDVFHEIQEIELPDCTCPAPLGEGFAIGVMDNNQTTLLEPITTQQIILRQGGTGRDGRPVWLSKEGEMWVPDQTDNVIYVYDALTWEHLDVISLPTSPVACTGPAFSSYHPFAGDDNRGQVWVSCTTSDSIAVYDGPTRTFLVALPLSPALAPIYDPYDIRVGNQYASLSLLNTSSSPGDGRVLQYNTGGPSAFMVSRSTGVGAIPQMWYEGNPDSRLFVTSMAEEELSKLNFQTLDAEYTCVGVTGATGVVTDPFERYVYVTDSTSADGVGAIFGFETSTCTILPDAPYDAAYAAPMGIMSDFTGHRIITTHPESDQSDFSTLYNVNKDNGDLGIFKTIVTGPEGNAVTRFAVTCPCDSPCDVLAA